MPSNGRPANGVGVLPHMPKNAVFTPGFGGGAVTDDNEMEYSPLWNDWFRKGHVPPHPSSVCRLPTKRGEPCGARPIADLGVCAGHANAVGTVLRGLLG